MKIQRINIGQIILKIVDEKGMSHASFAKSIGLKRQNVNKTIFEKEGIDTNLLCIISEVLDCNFFDYFKCNTNNDKKEVKATIKIEMGTESHDKTFRFVFGENTVDIK